MAFEVENCSQPHLIQDINLSFTPCSVTASSDSFSSAYDKPSSSQVALQFKKTTARYAMSGALCTIYATFSLLNVVNHLTE